MNRWWLLAAGIGVAVLALRRRPKSAALIAPLNGVLMTTPNGAFGARRKGPPAHKHQGIDLATRPGAFVRAVGDGVVVAANPGLGGIVRKLQLDEPRAFAGGGEPIAFVVYADLGSALREPGERVVAGEPLGVVGARGFVHFACKRVVGGREQFFDPALTGLLYHSTKERVSA